MSAPMTFQDQASDRFWSTDAPIKRQSSEKPSYPTGYITTIGTEHTLGQNGNHQSGDQARI